MTTRAPTRWIFALAGTLMLGLAHAASASGPLRVHVGATFVSGFRDVVDHYEDRIPYDTDTTFVPVGLALSVTYEARHGSRFTADVGPAGLIYVFVVNTDESWSYWNVPLGLTYGFVFLPRRDVSPYLRAGLRYYVAGGDYVDDSTPGPIIALGMVFRRTRRVGWGLELAMDRATIRMADGQRIRPGGFLAGGFVRF